MKRKKKKKINMLFKIIGIISLIITLFFCVTLFMLDMLPTKYLIIIYSLILILYTILLLLVMLNKIKTKVKTICTIILIIFDMFFGFGIYYISETISFVDIIDNKMHQKEEYYVMTLSNNEISEIKELQNKDIGVYKNINSDKAIEKLSKKIEFTYKEYADITDMFDDLEEEKISAIIINGSIKTLLETEFNELDSNLKEIYNFTISIEKKEDIVKVVDVTRQPFNIYIAGGDAYGDIGNVTNTDVNMVVTVDPVNKKLLLTSIPRDYYVNLPSFGEDAYDKLTHAGYYGIEESVQAVEKLLDIDINYYVKINFSTIEGIIDAIGGVDVYSDYNFCLGNSKDICFKKGMNKLNGYRALMFARERQSFSDGDVQRVKNQQKVFEAIINKATSSTVIITNFSEILNSVSSNFSTNLDSKSINRLVKMQLNDMSGWSIESQNLTGTDYSSTVYTFPTQKLYIMKRDEKSVTDAIEKIKEAFENK